MSALIDVYLIAQRNLLKVLRTPQFLLFEVLIQPVIFVLLFAFVFGGAIQVPGGNYVDYLLPGILIQTACFSGLNTAIALTEDLRNGLMDRFWSLPISRASVVMGRIAADTVLTAAAVAVMVLVGTAIGFRFHGGLTLALGAIGLAILTGAAFGCIGAFLGVALRTPEAVQGVGFSVIFPLIFASSTFVPVATMPAWLRPLADHSPITAIVDAARGLSLGHSLAHGPEAALVWLAAIILVSSAAVNVLYRRMSA